MAAVALVIGVVSLLTTTLGTDAAADKISVPYAIAWTAVAVAVLGFAIATPFYPHLRLQLTAVTAAWAMALAALIAAGGMRSDSTESARGEERCTRLALETSTDVELTDEDCQARVARTTGR
jgi:hypothetical protein